MCTCNLEDRTIFQIFIFRIEQECEIQVARVIGIASVSSASFVPNINRPPWREISRVYRWRICSSPKAVSGWRSINHRETFHDQPNCTEINLSVSIPFPFHSDLQRISYEISTFISTLLFILPCAKFLLPTLKISSI